MTKPATKLYTSWLAGVPALLGPEPAFRALRRSDLDYDEILDLDGAMNALRRLRAEPERYAAMIENGHARREEHGVAALTETWRQLLWVTLPPLVEARPRGFRALWRRALRFAARGI